MLNDLLDAVSSNTHFTLSKKRKAEVAILKNVQDFLKKSSKHHRPTSEVMTAKRVIGFATLGGDAKIEEGYRQVDRLYGQEV